jgi:hypothetical protein
MGLGGGVMTYFGVETIAFIGTGANTLRKNMSERLGKIREKGVRNIIKDAASETFKGANRHRKELVDRYAPVVRIVTAKEERDRQEETGEKFRRLEKENQDLRDRLKLVEADKDAAVMEQVDLRLATVKNEMGTIFDSKVDIDNPKLTLEQIELAKLVVVFTVDQQLKPEAWTDPSQKMVGNRIDQMYWKRVDDHIKRFSADLDSARKYYRDKHRNEYIRQNHVGDQMAMSAWLSYRLGIDSAVDDFKAVIAKRSGESRRDQGSDRKQGDKRGDQRGGKGNGGRNDNRR